MISSHLLSKSVLSALIVIAYAVILAPVVTVVAISFFDQGIISFPPDGLTLRWFVNAWARREFTQGLIMSLELALIVAVFMAASASCTCDCTPPNCLWQAAAAWPLHRR